MKKLLLILGFVLVASFAPLTHAADPVQTDGTNAAQTTKFVALAPIPGLTDAESAGKKDFADFFNNLYKYLIGIAAVLAVVEIIWGGLEISTKDSVSKHSDGKERITQAILGLVLVLSPVLVFSIINPNILSLSLGISPLDTKIPEGLAGGTQTTTVEGTSCTKRGTNLQTATCTSSADETVWENQCTSSGGVVIRAKAPVTTESDCRIDEAGKKVCNNSTTTNVTYCSKFLSGSYTVLNIGNTGVIVDDYNFVPLDESSRSYFDFANICKQDGGITSSVHNPLSACPVEVQNCSKTNNAQPCITDKSAGKCYVLKAVQCIPSTLGATTVGGFGSN
jgi:hypothetical protein